MQERIARPRRRWKLAAALAGVLSIPAVAGPWSIAIAQAGAARRSLIGTRCQEEIAKLCDDVKPGGGRLARCLRGHEAELSNDCKAALAASWGGRPRTNR